MTDISNANLYISNDYPYIRHCLPRVSITLDRDGQRKYLYTTNNTDYHLPELLLFCDDKTRLKSRVVLEKLSQFMRRTGAIPEPHVILTFLKNHYYTIQVSRSFISDYIQYEWVKNDPVMIQLVVSDRHGRYPHDPDYEQGSFIQPYLLDN